MKVTLTIFFTTVVINAFYGNAFQIPSSLYHAATRLPSSSPSSIPQRTRRRSTRRSTSLEFVNLKYTSPSPAYYRQGFMVLSSVPSSTSTTSDEVIGLKSNLIERIIEFRQLKERDGDLSIDFGVKGGELNQTSRAPQKVDFYSISKDVGDKAEEIIQICNELSQYPSPVTDMTPTKFLGDPIYGEKSPLHGAWKSLFTTAADANFSKNSTRGAARVQNIVNGKKGTITNVIDFEAKEDGTEPVLKQLNVIIKAIAVSPQRVELEFKYAKAVLTKFFFWKRRWSLYIPVPGPFITRCIVFVSRILRFGKVKKVPKGYFDLLYLDDDLRVHRTGEDNLFVQSRDTWEAAKMLLG